MHHGIPPSSGYHLCRLYLTYAFLDILTGSALSAFGSISLDCSFDQSGDFMSPPIEETNQIKSPVQQPAAQPKAWATVARK